MADPYSISLSGALAQTQRLANSANNTANARSLGTLPQDGRRFAGVPAGDRPTPFQPLAATQEAVTGANGEGVGTRAVFRPANPGYVAEYAPDNPLANEDGLVAAPNVDPVREAVERLSSLRAYQASLSALRTADETRREAIDLIT